MRQPGHVSVERSLHFTAIVVSRGVSLRAGVVSSRHPRLDFHLSMLEIEEDNNAIGFLPEAYVVTSGAAF